MWAATYFFLLLSGSHVQGMVAAYNLSIVCLAIATARSSQKHLMRGGGNRQCRPHIPTGFKHDIQIFHKDIDGAATSGRSEEHTSELQSLMRISYAVFCLKKKIKPTNNITVLDSLTQQSNTNQKRPV